MTELMKRSEQTTALAVPSPAFHQSFDPEPTMAALNRFKAGPKSGPFKALRRPEVSDGLGWGVFLTGSAFTMNAFLMMVPDPLIGNYSSIWLSGMLLTGAPLAAFAAVRTKVGATRRRLRRAADKALAPVERRVAREFIEWLRVNYGLTLIADPSREASNEHRSYYREQLSEQIASAIIFGKDPQNPYGDMAGWRFQRQDGTELRALIIRNDSGAYELRKVEVGDISESNLITPISALKSELT